MKASTIRLGMCLFLFIYWGVVTLLAHEIPLGTATIGDISGPIMFAACFVAFWNKIL